ncbi:hypothetical protein CSC02_2624 [Enterobacter hormaechei subsp. hoffmannii]|jgi:hypothetical protein|nr:hypothetical protein CSC02_2624 [Enterobacter hormaechei subsp. hoffmannii]
MQPQDCVLPERKAFDLIIFSVPHSQPHNHIETPDLSLLA